MATARLPPTLETLPQELLDRILSNCYSTTDVLPTDRGYISPQILGNVRLVNRYMRTGSLETFHKSNFRHFRIKLESRAPWPTSTYGTIDVALHIMNQIKDTEHAPGTQVKTMVFKHHRLRVGGGLDPTIPVLSTHDLIHLRTQLNTLFSCTPNLSSIFFDLRLGGPPLAATIRPGWDIPLQLLGSATNTHVGISLREIRMHGGIYDRADLLNFLIRHSTTLHSLDLRNVVLLTHATLDWDIVLRNLRDLSPALRDVRFRRLATFVPNTNGVLQHNWNGTWTVPDTWFKDSARPEEDNMYSCSANNGQLGNVGMVGEWGVKVGLNRLLGEIGSAFFDPALTLDALVGAGTLERFEETATDVD